jgi:hypothetical protein
MERIGRENDGGYLSCNLNLTPVKVAFSYGIGGRDTWGCDVAKKYNIPVYQYDPFDLRVPACNNNSKLIHFKPIGIAERTYVNSDNIKFEIFRDSLNNLNVEENVLVKIDIEGNEWMSLEKVLNDGSYQKISQLVLETHQLFTKNQQRAELIKRVLKNLYEKFYIVHLHTNNYVCGAKEGIPGSVIEVSYVNRNVINLELVSKKIPKFPHKLDSPNRGNASQDCPIDSTTLFDN